jgi:hypothetical protein
VESENWTVHGSAKGEIELAEMQFPGLAGDEKRSVTLMQNM